MSEINQEEINLLSYLVEQDPLGEGIIPTGVFYDDLTGNFLEDKHNMLLVLQTFGYIIWGSHYIDVTEKGRQFIERVHNQ